MDLALWVGVKLDDAAVIDAAVDRVDKYCDKLTTAIDNMHEELVDAELKRQRRKLAKETNDSRAHSFQVGDLVMVTVANTAMNPANTTKTRLRWQGPCEVVSVEPGAPSEIHVRLLGDDPTEAAKPVHWTRVKRFAGKDFHAPPRMVRSAHHDWGKFKIRDFLGWRVGDKGEVQLLVAWVGFEDARSTWEDISQLIEDDVYRVRNYLAEHAEGHPPLQEVYDSEYE